MGKNKNIEYENFVQGIYQTLLEAEGLGEINVVHKLRSAASQDVNTK